MAVSCVATNSGRDVSANAINSALGGGSIKIYTAKAGTLLSTIPLKATTIGTVSNGVITIDCTNTKQASADGTGTGTYAEVCKSDATALYELNVGIGAGYSVNLINNNIAAGQAVEITSASITVPAGT